jgi:hypothetical protein
LTESDHRSRAGKLGGATTKRRYEDDGFYARIGSLGGTTTMRLHGQELTEHRRRGGE